MKPNKIFYFLTLTRPANIITAVTDVLSGASLAFFFNALDPDWAKLVMLLITTSCLYAGGIVFNDVFDMELDKKERPERLLPSGKITKRQAITFGMVLFFMAVLSSAFVSPISTLISLGVITLALGYDGYFKTKVVLGPIFMGGCRCLNLMLGMSVMTIYTDLWYICFIPFLFISAITLTSRNEVRGNNRRSIVLALALDLSIIFCCFWFFSQSELFLKALSFLLIWAVMNFYAKIRAIYSNSPKNIMYAVKIGVLSLIPLNAVFVALTTGWQLAFAVLALLPLSMIFSRTFTVT